MTNQQPSISAGRQIKLLTWIWLLAGMGVAAYFLWPLDGTREPAVASAVRTHAAAHRVSPRALASAQRSIEKLQVGDRVLAENPEVSDQERAGWDEPDWTRWLKLSLVLPKPDGSQLAIEMLRSEAWVISHARLRVEDEGLSEFEAVARSLQPQQSKPPSYVPLRPAFQHLASRLSQLESRGLRLAALEVEMDLPELGLTGTAELVALEPAPEIQAVTARQREANPVDVGSVVTATFHHSSGNIIDLVASDAAGGQESIGTTGNHPFWSVDRQEYVQAGTLEPGERVLTFLGDTKRIVSKLPRPGPEAVYNLEVFGEHVYFVGQDGVLVHNNRVYVVRDRTYDQIVYVGKGTLARTKTAIDRVSKATGIPKSELVMESQIVGSEFKMRGVEQRGIFTALEDQGGSLTKRGTDFVRGEGNLVNRQRSYDPARLKADKTSDRYKRAKKFEKNRKDDDLWDSVSDDLGFKKKKK